MQDGAKWRLVQSVPTPPLDTTGRNKTPPVTVDGVMHFLYKFVDEDYVFRFDLESEEWKTSIQGPMRSSADKVENKTKGMVKLDDALCIVQRSPLNTWLVWLLTDPAKGTWVKAYTIPVNLTFDLLMPLTVMRDGRKLLFCACNDVMTISELHVYDPLTRTCTPLAKFPSNLVGNAGLYSLHLECFVSPRISIVSAQSV
jgi:F-box interacting protein